MEKLISIPAAANLMGVSVRTLQGRCARGTIGGAVRDGGKWRIPRTYDTRLYGVERPEHIGVDKLADVPADKLAAARKRLGSLHAAEGFAADAARKGCGRTDSLAAYCLQNGIQLNSLYRWMKAYRSDGLPGLVDKRGGQFASDSISPDAWEWFAAAWLDPRRPAASLVWRNLRFHNQQQDLGWTIPALRTIYELIDERIPLPAQVFHREGLTAYTARFEPYVLTDIDSIRPGAVWISDHHSFDCFVMHQGRWIRPWITCWMDARSRTIVGHFVSASPNSTTILRSLRRGLDQYGPPESARLDNGRDYRAMMFTGKSVVNRRILKKGYIDETEYLGLYGMLNIEIAFAIPYNARAKSIERFFATIEGQLIKTLPTYCGPDSGRRPEDLGDYLNSDQAQRDALSLEDLSAPVDRYVSAYNGTAHAGDGMNGKSPREILATRTDFRALDEGVLDLLLRVWSGELTVSKNGILFRSLWFGQFDASLLLHQGRRVRVAYNPDDLTWVDVYDARTWRHIARAGVAKMVAFGKGADDEALRQAQAHKAKARKIFKSYRDAARIADTDLVELTLATMEANARPEPVVTHTPTLRPVVTPLDGQVERVRQAHIKRDARKAAEAGIDLETLKNHPNKKWAAGEWIRAKLAGKPDGVCSKMILWEAQRDGICIRTLKAAKKDIGVQSFKSKDKDGGWTWILPVQPEQIKEPTHTIGVA